MKKHFINASRMANSKTWIRTLKNLDPEKRGKQLDVEKLIRRSHN